MNIIVEKNALFNTAIGEQKYSNESEYRFLTFIVKYEYKGVFLLFNTLSRQIVALTKDEYNGITDNIKNGIFEQLVRDFFLVEKEHDDTKLKEQIFSLVKFFDAKKGITNYVIMSTMECNARCFYCFEHGSRRYPMTDQTAHDVADYIIKKSSGQTVSIQWFGGEPLYNQNPINIISGKLRSANVEYKAKMISNGYLFDDNAVKAAKEMWNLKSVQITLDGTEEVYNRCKAYIYKTDESPFYHVLDNIERLLKANIYVLIRINMDKHNKDDLFKLVNILDKRFEKYKNLLLVYAWLLYDNRGAVKNIKSDMERHELTQNLIELENYIYDRGLGTKRTPENGIVLTACLADNPHSTVVLPDGHLGKCDHYSDGEFWGSIYNEEVDDDIINSWKEKRSPVELCKRCPLVPQCYHLKKCPDDGAYDCDEFVQKNRLSKVYRQMQNAYDKHLKKTV